MSDSHATPVALLEQEMQSQEQTPEERGEWLRARIAQLEDQIARIRERTAQIDDEAARHLEESARQELHMARVEQTLDPTKLSTYLRLVDEEIFSVLPAIHEPDTAAHGTVSVHGLLYPRFLRPWADFTTAHAAIFANIDNAFGGERLFACEATVDYRRRDLIWIINTMDLPNTSEQVLRKFISHAVEQPAMDIADIFVERGYPHLAPYVNFDPSLQSVNIDNGRLWFDSNRPFSDCENSSRPVVFDDRCGYAYRDHNPVRRDEVFVGEYASADQLPSTTLRDVLVNGTPSEDFFVRAVSSPLPRLGPHELTIACVLCKMFNHMILTGRTFGYIATRDGLIFLHVPDDDSRTLHYAAFTFPVPMSADPKVRRAASRGIRAPQDTAVAHMVTFCLLAVSSMPRQPSWVAIAKARLNTWPLPYSDTMSIV